jgi:hypothetical protein
MFRYGLADCCSLAEAGLIVFDEEGLTAYPDCYEPSDILSQHLESVNITPRKALLCIVKDVSLLCVVKDVSLLCIVKDVSNALTRLFLEVLESSNDRSSFLSFLDIFLDDQPGNHYEDAQRQTAFTPSVLAKESRSFFCYHAVRESEEPFNLSYSAIQTAVTAATSPESLVWRSKRDYGSMNQFPRVDPNGKETAFPPAAVARMRIAAWFDTRSEPSRPWRIG